MGTGEFPDHLDEGSTSHDGAVILRLGRHSDGDDGEVSMGRDELDKVQFKVDVGWEVCATFENVHGCHLQAREASTPPPHPKLYIHTCSTQHTAWSCAAKLPCIAYEIMGHYMAGLAPWNVGNQDGRPFRAEERVAVPELTFQPGHVPVLVPVPVPVYEASLPDC